MEYRWTGLSTSCLPGSAYMVADQKNSAGGSASGGNRRT